MTPFGMGGDVFGGPWDPGIFAPSEKVRPNNGDAERNAAFQRKQDEQKPDTTAA